jgi:glyoxylase-like metal-dependent hydrolase (beta-lactamase superfamily II)
VTLRILNGFTKSLPWPPFQKIGAACLLAETNDGLLLVDTGIGWQDYQRPSRMMRHFMKLMHAARDPEMALVRQLARLGHKPEDVRHIVLTHLHLDHAGGLPDFPHATVHLFQREFQAWKRPQKWFELYYDQSHFAHEPRWRLHHLEGERWYDFDAVRIAGLTPEVWLVPLPGHTSGHCGVALQTESGWIFQVADAVPANLDLRPAMVLFYRLTIGAQVPQLRAFAKAHPEVCMIAGHMHLDFFEKEKTR